MKWATSEVGCELLRLTDMQTDLLNRLRLAVEGMPSRQVAYRTEWLGYLPYGLYHWIEIDNQDISMTLPGDWSRADLEALENAGFLVKIGEWQNATDECDTKTTYQVALAEYHDAPDDGVK
jgi:hypothetical protein